MSSPRSVDRPADGGRPLTLADPVRCIWHPFLPGDRPPAAGEAAGIAAGIAEAGPLVVEVWIPEPWPHLPPIPFAQVTLFAPPSALLAPPEGVATVADLTPYSGAVPQLPEGTARACAFLPSMGTAPHLAAAAAAARDAGAEVLILPPLPFRLFGRLGSPPSSPAEMDDLWRSQLLPGIDRLRGLRLEVHDRFLLERLRGAGLDVGLPAVDAGCQAGTALIAVGPGGEVLPCPLWPVVLGNIAAGWEAIREGEARRRFLEEFPRHEACGRCRRWDRCHGGCPGASVALGIAPLPDPLCPEVPR